MSRKKGDEWLWQFGGQLERLADEIASGRSKVAVAMAWEPRVDVIEEERRFLLKAEISGVRSEDIQLNYVPERHSIVVRGVRIEEDPSEGSRIGALQLEIFYGEFQREVRLPDVAIDANNIRASYKNGLLTISAPKLERAPIKRTVKVQAD